MNPHLTKRNIIFVFGVLAVTIACMIMTASNFYRRATATGMVIGLLVLFVSGLVLAKDD